MDALATAGALSAKEAEQLAGARDAQWGAYVHAQQQLKRLATALERAARPDVGRLGGSGAGWVGGAGAEVDEVEGVSLPEGLRGGGQLRGLVLGHALLQHLCTHRLPAAPRDAHA